MYYYVEYLAKQTVKVIMRKISLSINYKKGETSDYLWVGARVEVTILAYVIYYRIKFLQPIKFSQSPNFLGHNVLK